MSTPRRTFIKQVAIGAAGFAFIPEAIFAGSAIEGVLPRSLPESQGISSDSIMAFIEAVEKDRSGLHSLMIVRHGKVVAEGWWDPYKPDLRHMLFSLSKSFTSTAVGFAVSSGLLKVEDKVTSFFPGDLPKDISSNLAAMRVKDLLTMNTGHDKDTMPPMRKQDQSWVKTFLSLSVEHKPGTFFLYNSGATYMLSAIVQKLTGKTVLDYLTPRFLVPLEIKGADWETSPQGINAGAYGLRIKTEDIARFGQFYLQKGVWKGKRLLPEAWIKEATSYQVPNVSLTAKDENSDWQQGYGYQFWRCQHNVYRGDGAVGQFCIVMEEKNAVIAITSETASMQGILNHVWEHLLADMKDKPLPPNSSAQASLKQKLASLTLLPSKTVTTSPMVAKISGKPFQLQTNEMNAWEATFTFKNATCTFKLKDNNGEHTVSCGLDHWAKGDILMSGDPINLVSGYNKAGTKAKVAAAGVWKDDNTFEMQWSFYETPHSDTVTCHFNDNNLHLEFKNSLVGKMANIEEKRPPLDGTLTA